LRFHQETIMSKLIWAAALVCIVATLPDELLGQGKYVREQLRDPMCDLRLGAPLIQTSGERDHAAK
jgi:hypothetical protein